jgi:hypothetical protein
LEIPRKSVIFLIAFGITDFIIAFFFGFTSSPTPLQLFHPDAPMTQRDTYAGA